MSGRSTKSPTEPPYARQYGRDIEGMLMRGDSAGTRAGPSRYPNSVPSLPPIQSLHSDRSLFLDSQATHPMKLPRLSGMQKDGPTSIANASGKVSVSQLLSPESPSQTVASAAFTLNGRLPPLDCAPFSPQLSKPKYGNNIRQQEVQQSNAPHFPSRSNMTIRDTSLYRRLSPPMPIRPLYEPSMPTHPSTSGDNLTSPLVLSLPDTPTIYRTANLTDPKQSPALSSFSSNRSVRSSELATSPTVLRSGHRLSRPPPFDYNLIVRQQPVAARACGFGERDRRVIDPPPILQLKIVNRETGAPELDTNAMLALNCTLLTPDGQDETEIEPHHPDVQSMRRLMGALVASPYSAKDENGVAGTFFVFADLSCRSAGRYRLQFNLMRIDPMNMILGAVHNSVSSAQSEVFCVYTAKDFPGMRPSTALLKALRQQGLSVGIKKGSEARKGKGRNRKAPESDDDGDSSAESVSEDEQAFVSSKSNTSLSPRSRKSQAQNSFRPKRKRATIH